MKKLASALLAIYLWWPSFSFCAATGDASMPVKAAPTASDKITIGDSADVNSTTGRLKSKDVTLGSLPISAATLNALNGKANISAFASQSAFTYAWGWTPGGVSAWSDVQALISGTGDYIKYDGTRGTPAGSTYTAGTGIDITSGVISSTVTGALPSATEGQILVKGASAWGAVDPAVLAFIGNVSRNTSTGVVSIATDSSPTNGSANFLTSDIIFDSLALKQDTLVSGTNIKTINNIALPGSGNIDIASGGGTVSVLTDIPYSDTTCASSGYYSGYEYLCVNGFYTQKIATITHSKPSPSSGIFDNFSADTSANYTVITGSISISGGTIGGATTWANNYFYNKTSTGSNDHYVQGKIQTGGAAAGSAIGLRSNGTTGYLAVVNQDATRISFFRFNGSSATPVTHKEITGSGGAGSYTVKITVSGSTFHFYIDLNNNGSFADSGEDLGTITDSTYSTGQYIVVGALRGADNVDYRADNLEGGQ